MAAFVQGNYADGAISVAFSSAQTAGNCNIAFVLSDTTSHITGVSDTVNGAYTFVGSYNNPTPGNATGVYIKPNIAAASAGANTVTASTSGFEIIVAELSGIATTSPADVINNAQGTSSTASVSATTTAGNDFMVSYIAVQGGGSPTVSTPYTKNITPSYNTGLATAAAASSAGTETVTWTASSSWGLTLVGLKTAGGPAAQNIAPSGIASVTAFGTATVGRGAVNIAPSGIASVTAFGTASVSAGPVAITPTGIASTNAFGTATIGRGAVNIAPAGIASTTTFGTALVNIVTPNNIAPAGIASITAFGAATIVNLNGIAPAGIASTTVFGVPTLTWQNILSPAGIASTTVFGTAMVTGPQTLFLTGIASTTVFGLATITVPGMAPVPWEDGPLLVWPPYCGQDQPVEIQVPATIAYREPPYATEEGPWAMIPYAQLYPPAPVCVAPKRIQWRWPKLRPPITRNTK